MASRRGVVKIKKEEEESIVIDQSISPGIVYVVDCVINGKITFTSSYSIREHEFSINGIVKKFPKVKIKKIEIKNPRYPQKQN